jgi:hypothetical protein
MLMTGIMLFSACSKDENTSAETFNSPSYRNPNRDPNDRGEEGNICTEKIVDLMAGQHINAGTVVVEQDAGFIYVTYNTTGGWVLAKTHLFVGNCSAIPVTGSGNPKIGQFPYTSAHNNVTSYTYVIPVSAIGLGQCGCIAAHAELKRYSNGALVDSQTGWGAGTQINNGGSWAMKFDFCPVGCD